MSTITRSATLATLCAALFSLMLICHAEAKDTGSFFGEQRRHHARDMHDAEAILKQKPQTEWSDQESEKYLFNALFTVYFGLLEYLHENNAHPMSGADLLSSGILGPDEWPLNPYNNWAPMTYEDLSAGFSAGNLVVQLCPPSEYSGLKLAPHPMTFTLGVYGANEDYSPINPPSTLFAWDSEPSGVVFITGSRFSNSEEQRKKKEAAEKRRIEAEKKESEQKQPETQPVK